MKRIRNFTHGSRPGSALVLTLIFVAMFSALAVALATLSGVNVQVAENQRRYDNVRACAESGLEIVRYWMIQVSFSGTTTPEGRFTELASTFQSELSAAEVTNIAPILNGATISIANVPLHSSGGRSFSAILTKISDDNVQVEVTGHYGPLSRTIRSDYLFSTRAHNAFDFGMASKGPIALSGNIELEGYNIDVESNAYIDCNDLLALSIIGNSMIAGEVQIRNSLASVYLQGGKAGVGGNFGMISGAIAANGVTFHGSAGGTINGSIINYSRYPLRLSGNSDLRFNRSGPTQVPAGFVPETILHYDPSSYTEMAL